MELELTHFDEGDQRACQRNSRPQPVPQLIQTREVQEQIVPARLSSQREVGSSGEGHVVREKDISILSSLLSSQLGNTLRNCSFGFFNWETEKVCSL